MLIQVVATELPSYFMAVFLLPKKVLKATDTTLKNFWWGFKDDHKHHYHPKAWNVICVPKEIGGLRLRKMEDVNQAMLAKLGWKLITNKDSL